MAKNVSRVNYGQHIVTFKKSADNSSFFGRILELKTHLEH